MNGLFKGLPRAVANSQAPVENPETAVKSPWAGLDTNAEHLAELNRLYFVIQDELGRLTVQDSGSVEVDLASEPDANQEEATEQATEESDESGEGTPLEGTGETGDSTPIVPDVLRGSGLERSSRIGD